jgi:ubiquinone/menaquinone biosynthesis C-methylase UbiE
MPSKNKSKKSLSHSYPPIKTYNESIMTNYTSFIEKNGSLTKCQKDTIINYHNLINRIVPYTNSNNQIKTLFDYIQSSDNIEQYTRLYILIQFFAGNTTTRGIMDTLTTRPMSDREIVLTIMMKGIKPDLRSEYRKCNKWNYAIQSLSKNYITEFKINPAKIKYLDIGCGSSNKTTLFHKYMNIPANNVHCTDIPTWGPYGESKTKIPFQFEPIINGHLNYPDNSFDFITCIFTLHHILAMEDFIDEIHRILKPNGRIMIIEHSVYTDYDKILIHIQHLLYSGLYDSRTDYIENPDYINLFNMYEWDFIMSKHKLASCQKNIVVFDSEFNLSYDNVFYGIYTKKK